MIKIFLDWRQTKFGTGSVPDIKYFTKVDTQGYEDTINAFVIALMNKMGTKIDMHIGHKDNWEEVIFRDCFEQVVTFLKSINALKPAVKINGKLELWKDFINLEPFYEGVAVQLKTMLIRHHYPDMAKRIGEGQIYSHWGLTQIKEAVLYIMEYFKKESLLNPVEDVLKEESVKKWVEDYIKWCQEHKEEIEEKNRKSNLGLKKEMEKFKELADEITLR